MERDAKIYVAGHQGLVGSAIVRALRTQRYRNIVFRAKKDLDLTSSEVTEAFFRSERPSYVFLAAAKVGGILANNSYPADFIRINLSIQNNVLESARLNDVKKLLFLGSSCIYPKHAEQPIREDSLLTGALEPTNEAYAIAKIAGLVMCRSYNRQYGTNYIAAMPTNLYGPNDNFDLASSHVLPALIRKFIEAKDNGLHSVSVWGSGMPRREFLYVDDLADACLFLMNRYEGNDVVNVGTGIDISIGELAKMIAEAVEFKGTIEYDPSKPDGTPRKLLDVSRLNELGWKATTTLEGGIRQTVEWYRQTLQRKR